MFEVEIMFFNIIPHFAIIKKDIRKHPRTFWNIKSGKKKFTISNATLSSPSITNHTSNEIPHVLNVIHKLFRGNVFRQGSKCLICSLDDILIFVVESMNKFPDNDTIKFVKVFSIFALMNEGEREKERDS